MKVDHDYYFQRGVRDAIAGKSAKRRSLFACGHWQAMAYKAGYDSIAGVFQI